MVFGTMVVVITVHRMINLVNPIYSAPNHAMVVGTMVVVITVHRMINLLNPSYSAPNHAMVVGTMVVVITVHRMINLVNPSYSAPNHTSLHITICSSQFQGHLRGKQDPISGDPLPRDPLRVDPLIGFMTLNHEGRRWVCHFVVCSLVLIFALLQCFN
jgi:hypothetical protein